MARVKLLAERRHARNKVEVARRIVDVNQVPFARIQKARQRLSGPASRHIWVTSESIGTPQVA